MPPPISTWRWPAGRSSWGAGSPTASTRPSWYWTWTAAPGASCRSRASAVDLVDLRAATLEEDLRARDFTVNALAAPVDELLRAGAAAIVDATGGLDDLRDRVVRPCGPAAISDDPVRALRGVRLAMRPGWRLHPDAEAAIEAAAHLITRVAAERLRDELVGHPVRAGGRPRDCAPWTGWASWRSCCRRVSRCALPPSRCPITSTSGSTRCGRSRGSTLSLAGLDALAPWGPALHEHLMLDLGGGLTRREALKLAALLHDVAKPETRAEIDGRIRFIGHDAAGARRTAGIALRWRLSRHAAQVLERLVAEHLRPMHLAQAGVDHASRAISLLPGARRRGARSAAAGAGRRVGARRHLPAGDLDGLRRRGGARPDGRAPTRRRPPPRRPRCYGART